MRVHVLIIEGTEKEEATLLHCIIKRMLLLYISTKANRAGAREPEFSAF